jgi:hypothetical protein
MIKPQPTLTLIAFALITSLFLVFQTEEAEAQWSQDFRYQMEIPDVLNLESSDSHFYVLSESEGLVVFRAHSDSLQWLYSSTGMQERGHIMESDIRFAYLYGNGRRLTVIEPTSVLGVYSSTVLPNEPRSARRVGNNLYLALGSGGLGMLSLESPESVDSDVRKIDPERFSGRQVTDLAADQNHILYVLSGNSRIDIFRIGSDDQESVVEHDERVEVNRNTHRIFLTDNELIGSDRQGNIFLIDADGRTRAAGTVNSPVERLRLWNGQLVARTEGGELWIGPMGDELKKWKSDGRAGNFFAITEDRLWVSEFNSIAPVVRSQERTDARASANGDRLRLKEIRDVIIPFPRPLILPLEVENPGGGEVTYSFDAPFSNARIRGNTFYWQPSATQTGRHQVEIIARTPDGQTSSQQFIVDLRPFNAPPRFTPARPVTIPVGEAFQLDIKAVDPDGMNQNLIRYLGVDMPESARLNERTGLFTWNPNIRQVGTHRFRVVATDQYGAASSQDFEIRVVEVMDEEEAEIIQEES